MLSCGRYQECLAQTLSHVLYFAIRNLIVWKLLKQFVGEAAASTLLAVCFQNDVLMQEKFFVLDRMLQRSTLGSWRQHIHHTYRLEAYFISIRRVLHWALI